VRTGEPGRWTPVAARIGAILTWIYVPAYGVAAVPVAVYLKQRGTLPWFEDLFPMYAGPWFDRFGHDTFVVLLVAFLGVLIVAAWAAWLVWRGSRAGVVLSLVLLPVEAAFWFGFGLPVPWRFGVASAALLAFAWRSIPAASPRNNI
jgi:hypothetical protein